MWKNKVTKWEVVIVNLKRFIVVEHINGFHKVVK